MLRKFSQRPFRSNERGARKEGAQARRRAIDASRRLVRKPG